MKSTHWSEAVKQAEAEGYARGLAQGRQEGFAEAAKCAERHASTPGRELAETIRALQPTTDGSESDG